MGFFQTKKIQSFIFFIIALISILWIFQANFITSSFLDKSLSEVEGYNTLNKDKPYLEKIDNFSIKEYSNNQVLLHIIEADAYTSYKNSPVQLETINITTFDEFQKEGLKLKSNRGVIFESGIIHLIGEVEIKSINGISHEFITDQLVYDNGQINSDTDIFYLGEEANIKAEGMAMQMDSEIMNLNGNVEIIQESGATLNSINLFINNSLGQKKYTGKGKTIYRSNDNTIHADNGFDINMNSKQTKLLGDVTLNNGLGTSLTSYNLLIDQSNGGEIFKSNSATRLQSKTVDIKANNMHYDVINKKLKLTDDVLATYE